MPLDPDTMPRTRISPRQAESGIESVRAAPLHRKVESCEVGRTALSLVSDHMKAVTDETLYVDAGFHIEGMAFY